MSKTRRGGQHEHLRAPEHDREILIRPDASALLSTVRDNMRRLSEYRFHVAGRPLTDFRRLTRSILLQAAGDYVRSLTGSSQGIRPLSDPAPPDPDRPLVMTGHQPELYHPGVWFKNHLAAVLARALNSTALNLVLDSDLVHLLGLSLPVRTPDAAHLQSFSFAPVHPGRTWEEHRPDESWNVPAFVRDVRAALPLRSHDLLFEPFAHEFLATFADIQSSIVTRHSSIVPPTSPSFPAVQSAISPVKGDPEPVEGRIPQSAMNASSLLTRARHRLERDAGLSNLELPASLLCSTHPFRLFLLSILVDLPRFRDVYNQSLALHRRVHHLRGSANPLPDLAPDEAPFWIYAPGQERLPLRVRDDGQSLSLLHDGLPFFTLSPSELERLRAGRPDAFDSTARRLADSTPRLRIRTRALTTTLFLRLFVADVFIHGVGGAKYDSVTDEIIRRYYAVQPPVFITASATLLLPLKTFPGSPQTLRDTRQLLRDLHCNPDRHLDDSLRRRPEVDLQLRTKRELVTVHGNTPHARREIFEALHVVNLDLAGLLADRRLTVQAELDLTSRHVAFNHILASREHPFVLFNRSLILDFYRQALAGIARA